MKRIAIILLAVVLVLPLVGCAALPTLACGPIIVGMETKCTITLPLPTPAGGAVVALTYEGLEGPASVTIASGAMSVDFMVEGQ